MPRCFPLTLLLALSFTVATTIMNAPTAVADDNAAPAKDPIIRVMSFNIRYNNKGDGPNSWPHRKDFVAEIISGGADVCGMQEVLKGQQDDLKARLDGFTIYGAGRDDGKDAGEAVPIAWRTARFDCLDQGVFWLSETPDVPGSKSWDTSLPRITTWVRLKDKTTGKTLLAVNTHLDHRGPVSRREAAKLIHSWVVKHANGDPVFLTGDFNTSPKSEPYKELTKAGDFQFRDSRLEVAEPGGPESTWNAFERVQPGPNGRIDFLFVSPGIKVLSYNAIEAVRDGRFASDHFPIVGRIELK